MTSYRVNPSKRTDHTDECKIDWHRDELCTCDAEETEYCPSCKAEIDYSGQLNNRGGTHTIRHAACECGEWERHTDVQNYSGEVFYYIPAPWAEPTREV